MHSWRIAKKIVGATERLIRFALTVPIWIAVVPFCVTTEFVQMLIGFVRKSNRHSPHTAAGVPVKDEVSADSEMKYAVSSIFLRDCRARLTPSANEEMYAVTGVKLDANLVVPSLLVPLEYERSSPGGVAAKPTSSHARLSDLSRHGHVLQAMFHSHPGRGPSSVRESSTDVAAQKRFERAGYRVITGIFSKDGYVRFFANDLRFRITVYGTGVKEIEHNVFKLDEVGSAVPVSAA